MKLDISGQDLLINPEEYDCSYKNCRQICVGTAVASSRDASPILKLSKYVFDFVAPLVQLVAVADRGGPV